MRRGAARRGVLSSVSRLPSPRALLVRYCPAAPVETCANSRAARACQKKGGGRGRTDDEVGSSVRDTSLRAHYCECGTVAWGQRLQTTAHVRTGTGMGMGMGMGVWTDLRAHITLHRGYKGNR